MVYQNRSRRTLPFMASLVVLMGLIPSPVAAQYAITNLVSNQAGKAKHQDKALVNAWGMSFFPGGPFWISDNGTGVSTFYDSKGVKVGQSRCLRRATQCRIASPGKSPTAPVIS